MAINPNIALQTKGVQMADPMAAYGRAQQIMANKMAMETNQRQLQSQNALRNYVQGGGRLDTPEGIQTALSAGANPKDVYEIARGEASAQQDQVKALGELAKVGRDMLSVVGDQAGWSAARGQILSRAPQWAQIIPEQFTPENKSRVIMTAEQFINKSIATPAASFQLGQDNQGYSVTVGGLPGTATASPFNVAGGQPAAPAATPVGGPEAPATAPQQGVSPDVGALLDKITAQGGATQSQVAILQRALTPQAFGQFQQAMQQNNFRVVPDEAAVPSSGIPSARGGVGGPDMSGVNAPGTPFYGKPFYEPPVSAGARAAATREPVDYVGATSAARREPIAEAAEREYKTELAKLRAAREAAADKPLTPKEQVVRRDQIAKDYRAAQTAITGFVDVINKAAEVRDLPKEAKEALTGVSGYFPSLTGSARTADTKLANLRGAITAMGKAAAAESGALGNMAVQEWRIISDQVAALDEKKMEPRDLDAQINLIINRAKVADANLRDAYYQQYEPDLQKMPGKFQLKVMKPGAKYRPGGAGVDANNPLLRGGR